MEFRIPNPSPPSYRHASHRLANTERGRRPTNVPPRQPMKTEQRLAGAQRLNARLLLSPVVLMVTLPLLLLMPLLLLPLTLHIAAISAARASAAAFLRSSLRSFFCFALSLRASAYGKRKTISGLEGGRAKQEENNIRARIAQSRALGSPETWSALEEKNAAQRNT